MRYDAAIVGGSFAGLSAALQLVRARRTVVVIDAGRPRNRFSAHSHGFLTRDGAPGSELLATARAQVSAYPTATLVSGEATSARALDGTFEVEVTGRERIAAKRMLLATGVIDVLPDIPGLTERWGKTVVPCPYCDGYEIGGGSIGVLATSPLSVHHAALIADWGDVTLFTNRAVELDAEARTMLARRSVTIEPESVSRIEGATPAIAGVRLADGRLVSVKALFLISQMRMASPLAEQLGCTFDEGPAGPIVRTDAFKLTTTAGVYAAGDAATMRASITFASADGVAAAVGLHQSLIVEHAA